MLLQDNFSGSKQRNGVALVAVVIVGILCSALGLFTLLVPVTYLAGGQLLYASHGWQSWQPGVGGVRFVALNAVSWALYAVALLINGSNLFLGDLVLTLFGFGVGMISYSLMVAALLTYQNDAATRAREQVSVPSDAELKNPGSRTFNEDLEKSALLHNGEGPTDLWWLFIGINTAVCICAAVIAGVADYRANYAIIRMGATALVMAMVAVSTALTNAIGGQWKHVDAGFMAFQPGKGGPTFVFMQGVGWTLFSTSILCGLLALVGQFQQLTGGKASVPGPLLMLMGLLGFAAQTLISASLFFYVGKLTIVNPAGYQESALTVFLRDTHFLGLNKIFNGGTTFETARKANLRGPDDWMKGEERYKELTENVGHTGDQYLIIGVGFVGKRLVQRLLDRGEKKIRLFDIVPHNPFAGHPEIEYMRGDVTKYEDVVKACQGVQTVYSTFAIIRFMDRLEHQAALSYRINVTGTENVLRACKAANVRRVVVTSSSHATTDEHSLPRLNRDENAPYVVRETAHNHYGWTKAAADIMCLNVAKNGETCADGTPIQIAIVRPCSGVFGGDDRVSFEKAMDLGVFPGVGVKQVMDWVYVENVVLGHILLEAALQRGDPGVNGEAFNISNNEALKNEDMWFTVMDVMKNYVHSEKKKSGLEFIFIPQAPLWAMAYLSELNQKIFKGKVSLGRDLDMMSPGMMATACMHYSYNSDKAERVLGYKPAYTLDEAIQKSLYDYWALKYPEPKEKSQ